MITKRGIGKNFNSYEKSPINDLILFCIFNIQEKREKATFERLVKECFTSFPKIFCLPKYPKWPDARKLDRPLRTLRNKRLIEGGPKTLFFLTVQGGKEAQNFAKIFRQEKLI